MIKTYWKTLGTLVECEIMQARGDRCQIKFWNTVSLEFEERWVDRSTVVFPKYSEYGAM